MAADTSDRPFEVKGLGEVAIRCADVPTMATFYGGLLGLPELNVFEDPPCVFYAMGQGYRGHPNILALFSRDGGRPELHPTGTGAPVTGGESSLHHIALSVDHEAQEAAMAWFDAQDVPYRVQEFGWVGWRGVFLTDPEGNTVELVAKDPAHQENRGT